MSPLDKCLQTLRPLIDMGDINGISLAEKAVDEFLAAHDGPDRQTGALHILQKSLEPTWRGASGPSLEFVNTVYEYMDSKMRGLRPNQ